MTQATNTFRRGFSFMEVLFAVMILGVGFIMIAAMFPVAIQQTHLTVDETSATRVGENARQILDSLPKGTANWPVTTNSAATPPGPLPTDPKRRLGTVRGFRDLRTPTFPIVETRYLDSVRGNQIDLADSRYAWVPMFQRDDVYNAGVVASTNVRFYIIVAAIRNRTTYSAALDVRKFPSDAAASTSPCSTLEPVPVTANFGADNTVTFPLVAEQPIIGEGAFVVVSNDQTTPSANGQIFRVSTATDVAGNWQLEPGRDLSSVAVSPTLGTNITVLVLGRGAADPTAATRTYDGAVQDIAVFTKSITTTP